MTPIVLSVDELVELTGYKYPSKQAAWLKKNGFKFRMNRFLQPKVDRAHYLTKMGLGQSKQPEPDWGAAK